MKLTKTHPINRYIDHRYSAKDSLLLRYRLFDTPAGIKKSDFKSTGIREGARILKLFDYRGVGIYICDESSLMSAKTFKCIEACLTIAICKRKGFKKIAFSSGANLGQALTLYGKKAGIETFFFQPKKAAWKLNEDLFGSPLSHLITVDKPEREVKKAALLFAQISGAKHVPETNWRFLATGVRALLVFEYMYKNKIHFDWLGQAVCAGFGPVGFYNYASKLISTNTIDKKDVPMFLGIQQSALCPMVKAWKHGHPRIMAEDIVAPSSRLLSPSLYNTRPDKSYPLFYKHLLRFGGQLIPLNKKEYDHYLPLMLKKLAKINIHITIQSVDGKKQSLENAGLIGLAGVLKAVDKNIIRKNQTVLSFLTGGTGLKVKKAAAPEFTIQPKNDLESAIKKYMAISQNSINKKYPHKTRLA